jgi:hypothetical protein
MRVTIDRTGSLEGLSQLLQALDSDPDVQGVVLLACDGDGHRPEALDPILRQTQKPVFGGLFPQLVFEGEHLEHGTIAVGLPSRPALAVVENVSRPGLDVDAALSTAFPEPAASLPRTLFVFVDGFSSKISALIDALFNAFGLDLNYLGGGAGSLSLKQGPCVITPAGLLVDAAVVALVDVDSGVGVAHGWRPVSGAYKVTESEGNVVHTLDWRPAFEVYREVVEAHSGRRFVDTDFFSLAKAYPFGIAKLESEMIVRDPLTAQEQSLVCVGEVPQGSFVRVLNGDRESLLAAARQARAMASEQIDPSKAGAQFFIDCISRVLFLGDRFSDELDAVRSTSVPTFGALTLGEIANNGRDYLEFYNKTAVVGLLAPRSRGS